MSDSSCQFRTHSFSIPLTKTSVLPIFPHSCPAGSLPHSPWLPPTPVLFSFSFVCPRRNPNSRDLRGYHFHTFPGAAEKIHMARPREPLSPKVTSNYESFLNSCKSFPLSFHTTPGPLFTAHHRRNIFSPHRRHQHQRRPSFGFLLPHGNPIPGSQSSLSRW